MQFDRNPRQYLDVVGESHYQPALERMAGGRTNVGARHPDHMAVLLPEPTNEWDPNAVRVLLVAGSSAALVGYLSREDAIAYRPVIDRVAERGEVTMCHASLKGGWDQGVSFGVMLRIGAPWSLMAECDSAWGPDPRWPSQVVASPASERPYNRSDCPYCGIVMDPLPKAKKKCPACGEAVYVRSGPDDIRYLLREADLAAHEARWGELYEAAADAAAMTVNAEAARLTRDSLASYASHGVRLVDLTSALADSCPACQAMAGRRFALADAPSIPIPECTNEICRCD
jgi:ssDNA-binding Zn-finger/Zn-ribbon topoisomerase 1